MDTPRTFGPVTPEGDIAPVGVDTDGNGLWIDLLTGQQYNSGEPLTDDERRDAGL